jgi:hypothetical protein
VFAPIFQLGFQLLPLLLQQRESVLLLLHLQLQVALQARAAEVKHSCRLELEAVLAQTLDLHVRVRNFLLVLRPLLEFQCLLFGDLLVQRLELVLQRFVPLKRHVLRLLVLLSRVDALLGLALYALALLGALLFEARVVSQFLDTWPALHNLDQLRSHLDQLLVLGVTLDALRNLAGRAGAAA